MAVEIGAVCEDRPDPELIGRLAGPLMAVLLGGDAGPARASSGAGAWELSWAEARAQLVLLPAGTHEFGDWWFLNVAAVERADDQSRLLAVVIASSAAILHAGRVVDELSIAGGGISSGEELLAKAFRGLARPPAEILASLTS